MGPDEPVYYWWTRVGASQGISWAGERPGIIALIATTAGTLHLPLVPAVAGLQYALAAMIGVVATAVLHGRAEGGRWGWLLAGVLAGLYAGHLGGGYVANLAFTLPFFAAGAALAARSRRGTDAAALLLGGGGLTHPQFFLVGACVLVTVAVWSRLREAEHGWTSDAGRVVVALAGAGAVVGAGALATLAGPGPLNADTSKDAFLRRAGLSDALHRSYLNRFWRNLGRYAPWVLLPTAAAGVHRARGFTRRFLVAWAVVTLLGIPLGLLTGAFPPDRIITFAFSLPVLAALGITWIWESLVRAGIAWAAWAAATLLVGVMAATAAISWSNQQTYLSPDGIDSATTAGRIAATLPAGTPLVFVVDGPVDTAAFLATQAGNVLRASVPPERAKDVYVYVGDVRHWFERQPTLRGDLAFDTLSRDALASIPPGAHDVFVIREFDRTPGDLTDPRLVSWSDGVSTTVTGPRALPPVPGQPAPSSPGTIAVAAVLATALLWVVGCGWSMWTFGDRVIAAAAAPGFGVAAIAVLGLAAERLGLPLTGSWGPTLISAVAGGLGYLLLVLQGKAQPEASTQVDEGPDQ